uniref:Uncharacterized protein n=1 Tax=Chrysotila carterae TaxID=13221 RepID=A0A7S4BRV8_CHRCT
MDWKNQIAGIIAETERNLGSRGLSSRSVGPPLYKVPRLADAARSAFEAPLPRSSGPAADTARVNSMHSHVENVLESLRSTQGPESRSAQTRLLENVKFELDVRGSLAQKQLEAVREETNFALQESERKSLDVFKQIEVMVNSAVEGERQMRVAGEETVKRLDKALTTTRDEIYELVREVQGTALDHGEILRRLEQELLAFKLDAETRLVSESRRVSDLVEARQRDAEAVEVATAEETLTRLKEVEVALLKEREFRKALEHEVGSLRSEREVLQGDLEAAVAREVTMSGGGPALASLEEKVKECGRLILRMGGDLIEEARRRQGLEAEVHELRMRLANAEAASRTSLGNSAFVPGISPLDFANLAQREDDTGSAYEFDHYAGPLYGPGFPQHGGGAAFAGSDILYGGCGGCGGGCGDVAGTSGAADFASASGGCASALCGGLQGGPPTSQSYAGAEGGISQTWAPAAERAVEARVRGLSGDLPPSQSSSCAQLQPHAAAGAPRAASLRMTREQLDARVQQILGKHGQPACTDFGTAGGAQQSGSGARPS